MFRGDFKPGLGLTGKRFPRDLVALYSIIAELRAAKQSTITIETVPHARIEIGNHATLFSWSEPASGIPMTKTSTTLISIS